MSSMIESPTAVTEPGNGGVTAPATVEVVVGTVVDGTVVAGTVVVAVPVVVGGAVVGGPGRRGGVGAAPGHRQRRLGGGGPAPVGDAQADQGGEHGQHHRAHDQVQACHRLHPDIWPSRVPPVGRHPAGHRPPSTVAPPAS